MKDKKKILLTICLGLALTAKAQVFDNVVHRPQQEVATDNYLPTKAQAHLQVGPGIGMYGGENSKGTDPIFGFITELGVNIPFKKPTYGFQPAIRFVQKGAEIPYDYGDKPNTTIKQQYLEVPLYFTATFAPKPTTFWRMGIGPYVAYGIGGKATYSRYETNTFGNDGLGMRRFDIGVGYDITYQSSRWRMTLGMEVGFIPGFENDDEGNRYPTNGLIYLALGIAL